MTTTPQAALLSDDEMRTVDLPTVVIDCLAAPHNLTYVNIGFQDRLHRFAIDVMEETLARVTRDDVLRWYPDLAKLQATQEPVQPPSQQIRICMQIQGGETHSTFAEYMGGDIGYLTFVRREWLPEAPGQQAEPVQAVELPDEREAFEAWAESAWHDTSKFQGMYKCVGTSTVWAAWQARAALSARKPLTDEKIVQSMRDAGWPDVLVRHVVGAREFTASLASRIGLEVKP